MKLTRRKLAVALVSATAVSGQEPQPAAADDLKTARDRMRANAEALAATPLPIATEPAFQFKA